MEVKTKSLNFFLCDSFTVTIENFYWTQCHQTWVSNLDWSFEFLLSVCCFVFFSQFRISYDWLTKLRSRLQAAFKICGGYPKVFNRNFQLISHRLHAICIHIQPPELFRKPGCLRRIPPSHVYSRAKRFDGTWHLDGNINIFLFKGDNWRNFFRRIFTEIY